MPVRLRETTLALCCALILNPAKGEPPRQGLVCPRKPEIIKVVGERLSGTL
jgi:hypothetical protein